MDPKHKEVLRKCRLKILDNISDLEKLLDELISRDVLSEENLETIKGESTRKAKIRQLIDILHVRGPTAFEKFVWSLVASNNDHLAEMLSDAGDVSLTEPKEEEKEDYDKWPLANEHLSLAVDVKKCKDAVVPVGLDVYDILHPKTKALVWILNPKPKDLGESVECHDVFEGESTKLDQFFKRLFHQSCKVDARMFKNKKAEDITKIFDAKLDDDKTRLEEYGCFFLVCLTSGPDCSKIYGETGEEVDMEAILQKLKDCQKLKDKPKILILQTYQCPGKDAAEAGAKESRCEAADVVHNEDDIYVIYTKSTKGYDTWIRKRRVNECKEHIAGSWGLQCLIYIFSQYSCIPFSFTQLIDQTNVQLRHAIVGDDDDTWDHVAEICFLQKCSKKRLYFYPGIKRIQQATS